MVLGIMPDEVFEEGEVPFLSPGSVLVVTTDGITEAMNGDQRLFGRDRLEQSLRKHARLPAQGILEGVLADVAAFCGDAPQHDDVTLAVVKRTLSEGTRFGRSIGGFARSSAARRQAL